MKRDWLNKSTCSKADPKEYKIEKLDICCAANTRNVTVWEDIQFSSSYLSKLHGSGTPVSRLEATNEKAVQ